METRHENNIKEVISRNTIEAGYQRRMKRKVIKNGNQGRVPRKLLRRMGYQGMISRN
jgi:hypothetical protein